MQERLNSVQVYKLTETATIPTRNNTTDCGLDIYADEDTMLYIDTTNKVKTGIAVNIPEGYIGTVMERSSLAAQGLSIGGGVIDPGYSGEVVIIMHNLTHKRQHELGHTIYGYNIKKGDKIAQLVISKAETPEVIVTNELWTSNRGNSGFGSSGR